MTEKGNYPLVRFGDVVRNVMESVDLEERDNGAFDRYIAGGHMQTDDLHLREWGEINDDYLGPAFHRVFRKGQVLYGSRRTYLRKVAVAHFDGVTANTTFVLEPKDNRLNPELLPFIMQSEPFIEHSIQNSKGSTNPYITWKDLANYQFPLPPKDEQRRIAEILWAADEAVERQLAVGKRIKELRSIFVTSVIENKSYGEFVPLSQAAEIIMGQSPPGKSYNENEKGDPLLNGPTEFGEVFPTPAQWTTDPKRFAEKGDILFCVRASVGKQNLADQKYAIGRGLAALRGKERVAKTGYIKIMLEALTEEVIREATGAGSTFANITSKRLKELLIPLPPMESQDLLILKFDSIRNSLRDYRHHLNVTMELRKSLVNNFL